MHLATCTVFAIERNLFKLQNGDRDSSNVNARLRFCTRARIQTCEVTNFHKNINN